MDKKKSLDSWDSSSSWTWPWIFIIPPTFSLKLAQIDVCHYSQNGLNAHAQRWDALDLTVFVCVRTDWLSTFPVSFLLLHSLGLKMKKMYRRRKKKMKHLCPQPFKRLGGDLFDLVSIQYWGFSPLHLAWVSVALSWLLVAQGRWRVFGAGLWYLYWLFELLREQKGLTSAFSASGVSSLGFWVPGIRTKCAHTWISVKPDVFCSVVLPLGITRNKCFSSLLLLCKGGWWFWLPWWKNKYPSTNKFFSQPCISVGKNTSEWGFHKGASQPHLWREKTSKRWGGWIGWSVLGQRGLWVSLTGDVVKTKS